MRKYRKYRTTKCIIPHAVTAPVPQIKIQYRNKPNIHHKLSVNVCLRWVSVIWRYLYQNVVFSQRVLFIEVFANIAGSYPLDIIIFCIFCRRLISIIKQVCSRLISHKYGFYIVVAIFIIAGSYPLDFVFFCIFCRRLISLIKRVCSRLISHKHCRFIQLLYSSCNIHHSRLISFGLCIFLYILSPAHILNKKVCSRLISYKLYSHFLCLNPNSKVNLESEPEPKILGSELDSSRDSSPNPSSAFRYKEKLKILL